MKTTKVHVLILAYKFPPYAGVGARRWGKFPKYLLEDNSLELHIISNNWKKQGSHSWTDQYEHPRFHVVKLQTPFNWFSGLSTITDKLVRKVGHLLSKAFVWPDESYFFFNYNFKTILNYIRSNNISVVIASGGPFSTNYCAAKLKRELPDLKIIHDFRDVWTEEYFFEYPNRRHGGSFHIKELSMEKFALSNCDVIESVTPGCVDRLKQKAESYGVKNMRYELIENGYDEADKRTFSSTEFPENVFDKEALNICHFGTAGFGRDQQFHEFLEESGPQLEKAGRKVHFHFFGSFSESTRQKIASSANSTAVHFHGFIPREEVQRYMYFADLHLIINDKVSYYAYGSKIFDAFMYRKPVLLISQEEALYEMIRNNKIGLTTNNSNEQNTQLTKEIIGNYEAIKHGNYFTRNFDYTQFSLTALSKKWIALIKNISGHEVS